MKRYVWLDINTGKFSNSWGDEEHKKYWNDDLLHIARSNGWKLIEYTCLNDPLFEFTDKMRIP